MNWGDFLRREWGAATFVATVIIGLVVVPIALYFGGQSATATPIPTPTPAPASSASVASPASTASPSASPTK